MGLDGWIKLHRCVQDNPIWKCEKFTRGQAWVDLILLANHKKSYFYKRGIKINVDRGQCARSSVELADRWKWSRTKVNKFLKDLEKEQQIVQQKSNITQLVTIVNYDKYQNKDSKVDSRSAAEKHIQECKEGEEQKAINPKAVDLAFFLSQKIKEKDNGNSKLTNGKEKETVMRWAVDIEKLNRIDKREYDHIEEILIWCKNDSFWSDNIMSGVKLRKQFDTLVTKSGITETDPWI